MKEVLRPVRRRFSRANAERSFARRPAGRYYQEAEGFPTGFALACYFFLPMSQQRGTSMNFSQPAALVASVWSGSLLAGSPIPPPLTAVR